VRPQQYLKLFFNSNDCKLQKFIDLTEKYVIEEARSIVDPTYQKMIISSFSALNNLKPNDSYDDIHLAVVRFGL
jgi:hypothetical protein